MRKNRLINSRHKNQDERGFIMRFLILGLMILLLTSSKRVDNKFSITMSIYPSVAIFKHTIYTIEGDNKQVNINYYSLKGINYEKLYINKTYIDTRALQERDTNHVSRENLARKIDSLYKAYSIIDQKKITVFAEKFPMFFKQIDSLLHSSEAILLYKSSKYQEALDGYSVGFHINSNKISRNFGAINPDENFAAPLYHFLICCNGFLNQTKNK